LEEKAVGIAGRMVFSALPAPVDALRTALRKHYLADETLEAATLLEAAGCEPAVRARIEARARGLALKVRANRGGGVDAFLREFGLGTQEGVVLLCLAEALLRIPDATTADRLIQEKLGSADWQHHLGRSDSLLVNASAWGLLLSGALVTLDGEATELPSYLERLAARLGEPAVRLALKQAMSLFGRQFVMGRTIEEALDRARAQVRYRHSFDMLGEAALTAKDAERYFKSYRTAIAAIGGAYRAAKIEQTVHAAPGVSVKLSALHPRFEFAQRERLARELAPRLRLLAEAARDADVGLTLDAEESERLEPTLDVFETVQRALPDYEGFGLAVQAYQKRARAVIAWLDALAGTQRRRIPVRLVKGAYWDSEIKRAQERGLAGYPVFTRKCATDVSYLACARALFDSGGRLYPQFATHNTHSVAAILQFAGASREFEFQRLHGMGEALYAALLEEEPELACRVYAPVGSHEDLLPYLVRRLLENGANTSFLHHALDEAMPLETLIADPIAKLDRAEPRPNPRIPLPERLYPERRNSRGVNLHDVEELVALTAGMELALEQPSEAAPLVGGRACDGAPRAVRDPSDRDRVVGRVLEADGETVAAALAIAERAQPDWDAAGGERRAATLERAADLIERERARLMALLVREGGKCVADADAEVREAADYCRYYARLAREQFARPRVLAGATGERNELRLHGRGAFACISPWNFPLAIFTGQVAAALAAGNSVIAKPATQTPLTGWAAVRLLHQAGAMDELAVGDPALLATDVGPVIDEPSRAALAAHQARMLREGRLICRAPLGKGTDRGHFFAPLAFEIPRLELLEREVFGPILHVVRYAAGRLDAVVDAINRSGYGLTLGIHSRVESTVRRIQTRARVGNCYVNRNQIGAVVGVQPFGGEGLSGTGPKAGGPHYLYRFALERTLSVNTAAIGGNAALLGLSDD
jgi:RHH-type proline utilization regulon transcriptional repressor/proline dehydrogenase/delta 1-pyrroline-5-carboxylate dehydrogenase